jgi:hypothetical protein
MLSAINTVLDWIAPLVPPALGAAVGLRYTATCSPRDRAAGYCLSVAMAVFLAPGISETFSLGQKTTVAVGFSIAMLGQELLAAGVAFLRRLASDPVATLRAVIDAIRGTK